MANIQNQKDVSRDRMMDEIAEGTGESEFIDFSGKSILVRGCDPQMAIRASNMLPPHLGNPEFVSCTADAAFFSKLRGRKWSVIFFAPGACRYSAAMMPIPGARSHTMGWSLDQYRNLVRKYQGQDIQIVETTEEREIIPRLRSALSKAK